jgi:hypothetical protein
MPTWRNWQTRRIQDPVPARAWGFEPLGRHPAPRSGAAQSAISDGRAEPSSQRVVAQLGSAPRSGRGGRRFESVRPDQQHDESETWRRWQCAGSGEPEVAGSSPAVSTARHGRAARRRAATPHSPVRLRVPCPSTACTVRLPEGHWPFKPAGEGSNPSRCTHRGVEQLVAREPHKLKVAGSSPATPTTPT